MEKKLSNCSDFLVKGLAKTAVEKLAKECVEREELFKQLVQFAKQGSETQAMKASWIMSNACALKPQLATEYLVEILEQLRMGAQGGVQRELLKCLGYAQLSEKDEGVVLQLMFEFLQSMQSDVGTKYYCIAYLRNAVKQYPDLKNELILQLEAQKDLYTDAWKRYVRKQITQLQKKNKALKSN